MHTITCLTVFMVCILAKMCWTFPERACTFMLKSHVKDINNFAHFHIFIHIFLKSIYKVKLSEKHKATSKHFQNTHSFQFWMMYIQSAWKYLNNCMSSFFSTKWILIFPDSVIMTNYSKNMIRLNFWELLFMVLTRPERWCIMLFSQSPLISQLCLHYFEKQ